MVFFFFEKNQIGDNKSHNQPSEQIRSDFGLEIADDQVLSPKKQRDALTYYLGKEQCSIETILEKKVFVYQRNGKKYILLHKAISYLGNPHPIFKKRIQMPGAWQVFCEKAKAENLDYDIRFVGVYHFQNNVIFVDFAKDTYLSKGHFNNSSAHVYTNDLYQAVRNGVFHREDQYGNHIYSVRAKDFADYLSGVKTGDNDLFELFAKFNNGFSFGQWLYAVDKIKEMHGDNWRHWQQAEWAGWFLEYKFNKFTIDNNTLALMKYVGTDNKAHKEGTFDFDIWFDRDQFYGDLKASDIKKTSTPGNDQEAFVECINKHDRFWYVIYEHETIKDDEKNYQATIERNQYIRSVVPNYEKDDMSYHERMKNSVRFMKMTILELNNVTFRDVLSDFNQGKQPDGKSRQKKFLIKKKDMDKYVVYRYTYKQA